jgi:hypothetical protein
MNVSAGAHKQDVLYCTIFHGDALRHDDSNCSLLFRISFGCSQCFPVIDVYKALDDMRNKVNFYGMKACCGLAGLAHGGT